MKKSLSIGVALAAAAALGGGLAATQAQADSSARVSVQNTPTTVHSVLPASAEAAPLPRVFAVINADGTKLRGKGATTVSKLGTGVYDVRFNRNITSCAWLGTVGNGTFVGSTGPASVTITGRNGTTNGLFVTTFDSTGAAADLPFITTVTCS